MEINRDFRFLSFLSALILLSGFVSSISMSELSGYKDSFRTNDIAGKIHINHYRHPSEWRVEKVNKISNGAESINKKGIKGIIEINRFEDQIANKTEIKNAWSLYNKTYEHAKKEGWFDLEKSLNDSFSNSSGNHYPSGKFINDGKTLDPERPEHLIYYELPRTDEKILVGVMYVNENIEDRGVQIGGPLTKWHYHVYSNYTCWEDSYVTPEMMHVWFIEKKDGPFSTKMGTRGMTQVSGRPEKVSRKEFEDRLWNSYPNDVLQCKPVN